MTSVPIRLGPGNVTRGDADDLQKWFARMKKVEIPGWSGRVLQKAAIQLGDGLVLGTPVGDARYWKSPPPKGYTGGRARGAWMASIGAPDPSGADDIDHRDKGGGATITAGAEVAGQLKAGEKFFWTNAVPYILRLTHGWSRQAPDGWVPRVVNRVAAQFK